MTSFSLIHFATEVAASFSGLTIGAMVGVLCPQPVMNDVTKGLLETVNEVFCLIEPNSNGAVAGCCAKAREKVGVCRDKCLGYDAKLILFEADVKAEIIISLRNFSNRRSKTSTQKITMISTFCCLF